MAAIGNTATGLENLSKLDDEPVESFFCARAFMAEDNRVKHL